MIANLEKSSANSNNFKLIGNNLKDHEIFYLPPPLQKVLKTSILTMAFCNSIVFSSLSQNQDLHPVNLELRQLFDQLTFPNSNIEFLYERSAKMSDSVFYQNNCPDTSNMMVWNLLYEEMYYAAHDTTSMTPVEDVINYPYDFYGDTIVMALMDYDFYHCVPNSLSTGDYFVFDTINNQLLDHPNPVNSPYGQGNIFAAAAMRQSSSFTNPVFRIDSNMFFTDNNNIWLYNDPQLVRIDFGDGTGWHHFDMNQIAHYEADYQTAGRKIINVELLDERDNLTIKSATCDFYISVGKKSTPADNYIADLPGIDVGEYHACENSPADERKVIIYIEGFDPLDFIPGMGNSIEDNYEKMIRSKYIDELRNFNYSFYVVNFDKSTLDLRINAMHVLNLIEHLKNKYQDSHEQFVIMGHSMGGVIGRFLLTYMETDLYQAGDFSPFMVDLTDPGSLAYLAKLALQDMTLSDIGNQNRNQDLVSQLHKTRTLITLDSPHQGASIPLALQHSYKKLTGLLPVMPLIGQVLNLMLDSKASKQLLKDHIDATPSVSIPSPGGNYNVYEEHEARTIFMNQLNQLGNYPNFCKIVAHSSADMGGSNQVNFYNQTPRVANDDMVDFEIEIKARILWVPRSISVLKFNLKTNPDGNGLVFHASKGRYVNTINVYWFGVGLQQTYLPIYLDNQYAVDAKPYCTRAAGYYQPTEQKDFMQFFPENNWNLSGYYLLNLASWNTSVNNGCFELASHVGWNGFASVNTDLSFCSEGLHFGFVPLQSALDYGNGLNLPLNHNIQNENINTKLSLTPFDLMIGYTDGDNHDHSRDYYDPLIYNVTGQPAPNCLAEENAINDPDIAKNYSYAYYDADLQDSCEVKRSLMCLEIGDEQMYLENWTLNRDATFQTQYDLLVNERNPYYNYPSQLSNNLIGVDGAYSKEAPFIIASNGSALFKTDPINSPSGIGFEYSNNFSGPWDFSDEEMPICVNDFAQGKSYTFEEEKVVEEDEVYAKLYPNPNNGQSVMLEYDFLSDESVNVQLFEVSGKKSFELNNLKGGANITSLKLNSLDSGMYLVNVFTTSERKVIRLIIH